MLSYSIVKQAAIEWFLDCQDGFRDLNEYDAVECRDYLETAISGQDKLERLLNKHFSGGYSAFVASL